VRQTTADDVVRCAERLADAAICLALSTLPGSPLDLGRESRRYARRYAVLRRVAGRLGGSG
jgi:hypothetical protein